MSIKFRRSEKRYCSKKTVAKHKTAHIVTVKYECLVPALNMNSFSIYPH